MLCSDVVTILFGNNAGSDTIRLQKEAALYESRKNMKTLDYKGIYVVLLTPFSAPGIVDIDSVERLVDFYIAAGVDGLFPCGSAGEAVHLDIVQKTRLIECVTNRATGRVSVIPGVIASNTKDALALAKVAREAGCDGIVVTPPIYYTFQPPYIEQYLKNILDHAGLPVVLYNIPVYAQPLSPDLLGKLATHEAVAGIKDSSGSMVDLLHFMDAARPCGRNIGFMSGREEMLFACLAVGGSGGMNALNAIIPEVMVKIYNLFQAGDFTGANVLQMSLLPLIKALYAIQTPIGFRYALAQRGFEMGEAVHPTPPTERERIVDDLIKIERLLDDVIGNQTST